MGCKKEFKVCINYEGPRNCINAKCSDYVCDEPSIVEFENDSDLAECACPVAKSTPAVMPEESKAKALADAHWSYINSLLTNHGVPGPEISRIGFHYRSAFIHGYKHAIEDSN